MLNDDEQASFESRFASLEEASRSLSTDVQGLISTLQIVAELQRQQREQGQRQTAADRDAQEARALADLRDARTRRVIMLVSGGLGVLVPLISLLVYVSLLIHVNDLLNANKASSYASCNIRNSATLENARRETALAALETDPAAKKIHTDSAAILRKSITSCARYKPKAS